METLILFLFYATIIFTMAAVGCVVAEVGDWLHFRKTKRKMTKALDEHDEYIARLNTGWK
jgi:hypothetical protein